MSTCNKSILLLDKKEREREILKKYLTDWGAAVDLADSGKNYDLIIAESPDPRRKTLLITDPGAAPAGVMRPIFPAELYKSLKGAF